MLSARGPSFNLNCSNLCPLVIFGHMGTQIQFDMEKNWLLALVAATMVEWGMKRKYYYIQNVHIQKKSKQKCITALALLW